MDVRELEDWTDEAEEVLIFRRSDLLNEIVLKSADRDTLNGEFMKLRLALHNLQERQTNRETRKKGVKK